MTTEKYPARKFHGLGLLVLIILLCSACGAKQIRGEPPIVRMNELSHHNNTMALQLSIRNINEIPMEIREIDFTMSVNDDDFIVHSGAIIVDVVANSKENWTLEVAGDNNRIKLLNQLESGEINSLPYALKGSIKTLEEGTLRFEYEGHIYPLPGRPGYFR